MKIIVEFDNEEEFKARIKNPRNPKDGETAGATGGAAAPLMPPQGGSMTGAAGAQPGPNFAPQAQFTPPGGGYPGASNPVGDPAAFALAGKLGKVMDNSIASGQPIESILGWFREQSGAPANATAEQIKSVYLPKLPMATLESMAKVTNAHAVQ